MRRWSYRPARRWAWLLPVVLLPACAADATRRPADSPTGVYRILEESETLPLELVPKRTIRLGGEDSAAFVNEVRDIARGQAGWLVLDAYAKTLAAFDSAGRLVRRIARGGRGPGELMDPFRVEAGGDPFIYVADLGRGPSLTKFTAEGEFHSFLSLKVRGTPTDIAAGGGYLAVMTSALSDPERLGWEIVEVFDTAGQPVKRFCRLDPRYPESSRTEGMIHRVAYGSVGLRGTVAYCSQSISPVIQLVDLRDDRSWTLDVAPPLYVPPTEQHTPANRVQVFEFLSAWTAHTRTIVVPGAVLSMYSRYDPEAEDFTRWLFACRTDPGWSRVQRCGIAAASGILLYAESIDEILLAEPPAENESAAITLYAIVGL